MTGARRSKLTLVRSLPGVRILAAARPATRVLAAAAALASTAAIGYFGPNLAADRPDDRSSTATTETISASTRYQVTFAARACSEYGQIMAGWARDDRIEAAAELGGDSEYQPGQLVDPDLEARVTEGCEPLLGWALTLGSGYRRDGSLSQVTSPVGEIGPTRGGVRRLDGVGREASGSLAGAVTVQLTAEQVRLANLRQLWAQGGHPGDPLLGRGDLAFGALRCGADRGSGGNVTWLGFPAGFRHLYCFAYYVRGSRPTASIMIRASTTRPVGYPQRFTFAASFGYAPTRTFTLVAGGSGPIAPGGVAETPDRVAETRFVREISAYPGFRISSQPPAGWRLADLSCEIRAASGGPAAGVARVRNSAGEVDLALGAGESATCGYSWEPPVEPSGLSVRVITDQGAGPVTAAVTRLALGPGPGPGAARSPAGSAGFSGPWTLTGTLNPGSAEALTGGAGLADAGPGTYQVKLTPPDPALVVATATCAGSVRRPLGGTVTVLVGSATPVACLIRLARPDPGLRFTAKLAGGAGVAALAVEGSAGQNWTAVAKVPAAGEPPLTAGSLPAALPAGSYLVTPVAPAATTSGEWSLTRFDCGPATSSSLALSGAPGAVGSPVAAVITLGPQAPAAVCAVEYRFVPATRLEVLVRVGGDQKARAGPLIVEVSCADGSTGRVEVDAGQAGEVRLATPLAFLAPTRCRVTQPATGVSRRGNVRTVALVEPALGYEPLALPTTIGVNRQIPRQVLTVAERFDTVVGRAQPGLLRTDTFTAFPAMLIGCAVIGIGVLAMLILAIWWRDPSRTAE